MAAARARRRAEEAARAAAAAEAEARRIEHERDLAEVRRHIDEERVRLERQRAELAARATPPPPPKPKQRKSEATAGDGDVSPEVRKQERERLVREAARIAAELAALDEAERTQAERDEQYRLQLAAIEAERQRSAAEHQALAEAMQRELDEIDQRLEQRAQERAAVAPTAVPLARVTRKARLRVAASVMIDHAGTQVALPLVNVSRTGALFTLGSAELPTLRVGLALFITLFATDDVTRQVDLMARVVRIADGQAALDWSADAAAALDLARLLDELSGR